MIRTIARDASPVARTSQARGIWGLRLRSQIPVSTGSTTIHVVSQTMPATGTSTRVSASSGSHSAITSGHSRVATLVIVTERMRSPRSSTVITFDAIAPGMHPTSTIPVLRTGSENARRHDRVLADQAGERAQRRGHEGAHLLGADQGPDAQHRHRKCRLEPGPHPQHLLRSQQRQRGAGQDGDQDSHRA
jgi:hypothetical protein